MREIRLAKSAQLDLLDIWLNESVKSTEIADRALVMTLEERSDEAAAASQL
jgi:hypothetical protein